MKKVFKSRKTIGLITSILAVALFLVGCGATNAKNSSNDVNNSENKQEIPQDKLPIATINIEDFGTIEAELYPNIAPNTVNNFISLANSGFYDGLTFHRIIKDFMIQGGDPNGDGTGGPGYKIKGEFTKNKFENNLKHEEGVLSMARSQAANSAGSQFFIMTKAAPHLDGSYAAFGKVTSGLDVLHNIENVETNKSDKPLKDVVIESITVDTKGTTYAEPEKMK